MSTLSSPSGKEVTTETPASCREQTPKARPACLFLLLSKSAHPHSTKYHNPSVEPTSLLREALQNARPRIPHISEQPTTIPQGELVTSHHPRDEVVVSGAVEELARAMIPLTAGYGVRVVGMSGDVREKLRKVLGPCNDGLASGVREGNVDGERVALLIGETADMSSISEFFHPVHRLLNGTALYTRAGIFESLQELLDSLMSRGKMGTSTMKVAELHDAIEALNKLYYDITWICGDSSSIEYVIDNLTIPRAVLNILPAHMNLTTDAASNFTGVRRQRITLPFKNHLALLRQYIVGRFDNSAQIAREKASGGQRTAYAVHINDVIDDRIEGGFHECVFHLLEETYKYAPGERFPHIAPLILRFEDIEGAIALSSIELPDYVEKTSLRNDNPSLWFGKAELKVSPSFPERQMYQFNEDRREFNLDVEVRISETIRFHLSETLAFDRLVVSEKLWISGKLKAGFYEEPFVYDRVHS